MSSIRDRAKGNTICTGPVCFKLLDMGQPVYGIGPVWWCLGNWSTSLVQIRELTYSTRIVTE